eukprot:TRINITY_DN15550_c0_g2_i1.p1 TRINITY_DN15550_c0_g2~~TRINITY_DN15550_c0_g2_i1.p1  ORF type:complete len:267 (+),score=63.68 TRINITY_DN15550_c0_g2_i1:87-887(+)
MSRFSLIVFTLLCASAVGTKTQPLRKKELQNEVSFVSELKFTQKLRICNGFPSQGALQLFIGKTEMQGKYPLRYKECRDYTDTIREGDRIEFKSGVIDVGAFTLSDLPDHDAILLLVIYQRDGRAAAFKSHTFAPTRQAQVAVLDAYDGATYGEPVVMDLDGSKIKRRQALMYDTAMAISQGSYEVALRTRQSASEAKTPFNVLEGEAYVVLRTGSQGSYDQDVVVFPKSVAPANPPTSRNGASSASPSFAIFMMALLGFAVVAQC